MEYIKLIAISNLKLICLAIICNKLFFKVITTKRDYKNLTVFISYKQKIYKVNTVSCMKQCKK